MKRPFPNLDQTESRPEQYGSQRARPYQDNKAPGTGAFDRPLGAGGHCWCGEVIGHDWPGKPEQPHPREERNQ